MMGLLRAARDEMWKLRESLQRAWCCGCRAKWTSFLARINSRDIGHSLPYLFRKPRRNAKANSMDSRVAYCRNGSIGSRGKPRSL